MENNSTVMSDLAIPPGEHLEEVLEALGMTKDELARRMGRPASQLSYIYDGRKRITEETAMQLEKVVGVPAHIWLGLESEYRLTKARMEDQKQREGEVQEEANLVTAFCYNDLVKLGEVPNTRKPVERVHALHRYFGVTSLKLVQETKRYQAAFRCGSSGSRSPEAIAAWLRYGERQAQQNETAPFAPEKLKEVLQDLRSLTEKTPQEFEPELRARLASCGVALVICPHFPKTSAHGATFRMGGSKAVLMITVRGAWADVFWFSLFHELGHILLHGSTAVIVENGVDDEREQEADEFAGNLLIPKKEYARFIEREYFRKEDVRAFAGEIGVHPGVVVGRLQHDGLIEQNWMLDLRVKLRLRGRS